MIKIAIVDDEEQTREQILRTLKENIQEQHEVEIKLYASGESFFEEIQKGETADIFIYRHSDATAGWSGTGKIGPKALP